VKGENRSGHLVKGGNDRSVDGGAKTAHSPTDGRPTVHSGKKSLTGIAGHIELQPHIHFIYPPRYFWLPCWGRRDCTQIVGLHQRLLLIQQPGESCPTLSYCRLQ